MAYGILEKVPYRPTGTQQARYAIRLLERQGLSLLFAESSERDGTHHLVIATQHVAKGVFTEAHGASFPLEGSDLAAVGPKLSAIGEDFEGNEIRRYFRRDEDSW